MSPRAALLSVSDRTGIIEFARALTALEFTLLVTSGTGKALAAAGIDSVSIESYTGQPEILDGRVKTLHPKIYAGLLARRDKNDHMTQIEQNKILPISVVAVNLYPFVQQIANGDKEKTDEEMIELIDIGGPTMIRAAAKNFASVYSIVDPADYSAVIESLKSGAERSGGVALRRNLAAKVFTTLANDNLQVAQYLSGSGESSSAQFGPVSGMVLERQQSLRYGENPHQSAVLYSEFRGACGAANSVTRSWQQHHGKELSYNNLLDLDAALRVVRSIPSQSPFAVILKHLNPCGAAYGADLQAALQNAKFCDPRSHFGGIIAVNGTVTLAVAHEIREDFAEIVVAPSYEPKALEFLRENKNLRVIEFVPGAGSSFELRSVEGGVLMQTIDNSVSDVSTAEVVSSRAPSPSEMRDLDLAWRLCQHVKSNAVTIVKDGMLVAVGGGQMSRVDSVELALAKAKTHSHNLQGAVAASDAFFPFPDGPETLAKAGITSIIAPRGAKRDADAVAVCNQLKVSLLFTADRHFRH